MDEKARRVASYVSERPLLSVCARVVSKRTVEVVAVDRKTIRILGRRLVADNASYRSVVWHDALSVYLASTATKIHVLTKSLQVVGIVPMGSFAVAQLAYV